MITIKFEGTTLSEILEGIQGFLNEHNSTELIHKVPDAYAPEEIKNPSTKDKREVNDAVKKRKKKAKAAKKAEPVAATRSQVSEAVQTVTSTQGLEAARQILDGFGVSRISEIKEQDFGAVVSKWEEVSAEV